MKIKDNDYNRLKSAIEQAVSKNPELWKEYKKRGLSPKRYRWDMLHYSNIKIGDGAGMPGDINLYQYMDDTHIDTALRKITDTKMVW